MNNNELPKKTFFDIIVENSRVKTTEPAETTTKKQEKSNDGLAVLGFLIAPFVYAAAFYLLASVLAEKFSTPHFSYWDSMKVYIGFFAISTLFNFKKK
jgi:hypothetical protein